MAATPSASVADPPPKPPPDKPRPDKPRSATHLIQSSPATAADLGHISQSSSPARDGPSTVTGQTFKSSSQATTMLFPAIGEFTPAPVNNVKQSMASKPSFAEVTKQGSSINKRKAAPELHMFGQPNPLPGAKIISENGVEILKFEDETTDLLAASLKWALVGKFSHNLPHTQTVGKFLTNLNLRGEFEIKWLSYRQMLIVLTEEEDYAYIWTKGFWVIDGCPMRALKWTPTFNARTECPFAPVWASLPGLPVHLFEKRALHLIASQLGKPVMVDAPTATRKRASLARICVEINLLYPLKDVLNLSINGHLIQQPIIYEDMPRYCSHCCHIGHTIEHCFVKNVALKTVYDERRVDKKRKTIGKENLKWVVRDRSGSVNNPNALEIKEGKMSTVHTTNTSLQLHANTIVQSMQVSVHNSELGDVDLVGSVDPAIVLGLHDSGKDACTANKDDNIFGGKDMQSVNSENFPHHHMHASKSGEHAEVESVHGTSKFLIAGEVMDAGKRESHGNFTQSLRPTVPVQMSVNEVNSNFGVSAIEEGEFIASDLESTFPVHTGFLRNEHAMVDGIDPNGHTVLHANNVITVHAIDKGESMECGNMHSLNSDVDVLHENNVVTVYATAHVHAVNPKIGKHAEVVGNKALELNECMHDGADSGKGACNAKNYEDVIGDVAMKSKPTLLDEDGNRHLDGDIDMMSAVNLHNSGSNNGSVEGIFDQQSLLHAIDLTMHSGAQLRNFNVGVGTSAVGPSGTNDVAMHSDEQLLICNAGVDSDVIIKSAANLHNPGNNNFLATVVDNMTGINPLHATDDDDVTMQPPGTEMLFASADDDAIMAIAGVHSLSDLNKVDGPYSAGPLALPMKPKFQFNPAKVTNGHADVLHDDIFRVSGVMPAEFPKQLVLSPFQTSNVFTKPLKTIYPDGSVLVNNAYYSDAFARRDCFDHESPRTDLSNDESNGYNEMDDIDDDFEDRPFHRTRSYPNLNDFKKAEYGGRITRSMARNGKERV